MATIRRTQTIRRGPVKVRIVTTTTTRRIRSK